MDSFEPPIGLSGCISALENLKSEYYGTEEGVRGFSDALRKLSNDDAFKFASQWLVSLKQANENDEDWSESELLHYIYVVSDAIVRGLGTTSLNDAFKKQMTEALSVYNLSLFEKRSSLETILKMWKQQNVYEKRIYVGTTRCI